ncbi:PQQ-dependent sugar dehydrogenase [Mucilaginibacter pineti]|nr:PQQ-dependent sugar dehydrogenase [Mucilaginibacter pineti]
MPASTNKWIPNDNPFNATTQNAVWTYGHRNPQGLAYAVINGTGYLYESEHGPFSDDEVNIIEKGKNYGHPLVIGYADGNYDGLAAGVSNHPDGPGKWHTAYPLIVNEKDNAKTIGADYRDPLITLYPNSKGFLNDLFSKLSAGQGDQQWPSEAPSSIAVYTSTAIPGWKNSLLLPTLKGGKLIRLKLNAAGDKIEGDTICYFKGRERYRDIALSPDGRKIYLAVDSSAVSSGPSKANPKQVSYRGCIIEYHYVGQAGEMDNKKRP